jgi:hypothetical protein
VPRSRFEHTGVYQTAASEIRSTVGRLRNLALPSGVLLLSPRLEVVSCPASRSWPSRCSLRPPWA